MCVRVCMCVCVCVCVCLCVFMCTEYDGIHETRIGAEADWSPRYCISQLNYAATVSDQDLKLNDKAHGLGPTGL